MWAVNFGSRVEAKALLRWRIAFIAFLVRLCFFITVDGLSLSITVTPSHLALKAPISTIIREIVG